MVTRKSDPSKMPNIISEFWVCQNTSMHVCQAWAVPGTGESVASDQDASISLLIKVSKMLSLQVTLNQLKSGFER